MFIAQLLCMVVCLYISVKALIGAWVLFWLSFEFSGQPCWLLILIYLATGIAAGFGAYYFTPFEIAIQ